MIVTYYGMEWVIRKKHLIQVQVQVQYLEPMIGRAYTKKAQNHLSLAAGPSAIGPDEHADATEICIWSRSEANT